MSAIKTIAASAALAIGLNGAAIQSAQAQPVKSIVLVHGGFVDGSGWDGVYKILKRDGFKVSVVQNPTVSLKEDAQVARRAVAAAGEKVVLVGHSYGGAVISEAGTDPNVAALVYIAAFAPDKGESIISMLANPQSSDPVPPILPPVDGFLFLDKAKFAASFAADVRPQSAQFMGDAQVPFGLEAAGGLVTDPAWRVKPSWYLLTTDDKMIPPRVQQQMAARAGAHVETVAASHAVYVSHPEAVAKIIEKAATAVDAK